MGPRSFLVCTYGRGIAVLLVAPAGGAMTVGDSELEGQATPRPCNKCTDDRRQAHLAPLAAASGQKNAVWDMTKYPLGENWRHRYGAVQTDLNCTARLNLYWGFGRPMQRLSCFLSIVEAKGRKEVRRLGVANGGINACRRDWAWLEDIISRATRGKRDASHTGF